MKKIIQILILIILSCFFNKTQAQENYVQISHEEIYSFLDELASEKIIELNSCVKPYSRKFISSKLYEAQESKGKMTKRMRDKLAFFLLDYGKENKAFLGSDFYFSSYFSYPNKTENKKKLDLFHYSDSLFSISINPIIMLSYKQNEQGGLYQRSNGAEAHASFGKHWGMYVSLRDNYFSTSINEANYLIPNQGIIQKKSPDGSREGEQIHGGISYSWNWGSIGILKDHMQWGDSYHKSNIISDRAPSFARIDLKLNPVKWFEFNYFHAWLVSNVIDSTRSWHFSNGYRTVMHNKYMAANMFSFKPFKQLDISAGNSVVYSDIGIHPGYLIPVMFFKAVDHSINGQSNWTGQNAQMFFNVSSRQIKHLHLYTSLFIDEIALGRMWDDSLHSNFFSWKIGAYCSNLIPDIAFGIEYTRTNPIVYKHFIPTTSFESNDYTMGHYLKDNSQQLYVHMLYQPHFRWRIKSSFEISEKGPEFEDIRTNNSVLGLPFLSEIIWYYKAIEISASYTIMHNCYLSAGARYSISPESSQEEYFPEYYSGKQLNVFTGIRLGF